MAANVQSLQDAEWNDATWRSYLAQHPKAHGERMRALLPRLLALTGGKATKRRGVSTNSAAVQWLTPLMKEAALGPPDALVGARDETQDWLETLRDPGVRGTERECEM